MVRPRVEVAKVVRGPLPFDPTSPYEKEDAPVPPFATPKVPLRYWLILREEVETTEPLPFTASKEFARFVIAKFDVEAFVRVVLPEKVLLFASKVVEAPVKVVCDCQYAALVVEKKLLTLFQYAAEVVEKPKPREE